MSKVGFNIATISALDECRDLLHNGYSIIIQCLVSDGIFVKLKHQSNGRTLIVRSYPDKYEIREGKRVLKCQDYSKLLVSD